MADPQRPARPDEVLLEKAADSFARRRLVATAVVLVTLIAALVALLVYLLWLQQPASLGPPVEGIQPLLDITGPGVGKQPRFSRPLGAAFGAGGSIYVADTGNNRICVFDARGRFVKEWGGIGVAKPAAGGTYSWKPGLLNFPAGIATSDSGDVYVADFHNDCIQVFDKDGKWLRRFPDPTKPTGKGGSGQGGKGIAVTAVAVSGDKVYATDTYQVLVFSTTGRLLQQFGKPGAASGDLDHPNGIAVSRGGTIYVSDSNHARVTAFAPDGKVKWNAGRIPSGISDSSKGLFELPRGVGVLPDGDLIVVDVFAFDLVRLTPTGQLRQTYGGRGTSPGRFNFPNSVSVLGSTLAIADKENNRVQVLRLVAR